jgi:hypothetical protein
LQDLLQTLLQIFGGRSLVHGVGGLASSAVKYREI